MGAVSSSHSFRKGRSFSQRDLGWELETKKSVCPREGQKRLIEGEGTREVYIGKEKEKKRSTVKWPAWVQRVEEKSTRTNCRGGGKPQNFSGGRVCATRRGEGKKG